MTTFRVSLFLVSILFIALIVSLMKSLVSKQIERKLAKTTRGENVEKAEMLLKKIWIYPLKSGKRVEVKEAEIRSDGCGLMYDRMFMVVNKMGEMVSQRNVRAMASISTSIDKKAGVVRLSAPGMKHNLELNIKPKTNEEKNSIETEIWRVKLSGLDCGREASDWITSYLNPKDKKKSPYRILRIEAPISRHKDPKYSPMLRDDDLNVFHDGCHMLIANERTAEDICKMINKKAESEHQRKVQKKTASLPEDKKIKVKSMLRSCRPNFVVDGGVPYVCSIRHYQMCHSFTFNTHTHKP